MRMQNKLASVVAGAVPFLAAGAEAAVDIDGLRTLGLDPNDIEYVVIGHSHNDHWAETLRKCTREVLSQKRAEGL